MELIRVAALTDGKPAMRADGLTSSPVYLRARMIAKGTVPGDKERFDVAMKVEAYQVDEDGNEVRAFPAVPLTIHGGGIAEGIADIDGDVARLKESALQRAITFLEGMEKIGKIPEEMIE